MEDSSWSGWTTPPGPIRAYSLVMAFRGPYSSRMDTPG